MEKRVSELEKRVADLEETLKKMARLLDPSDKTDEKELKYDGM
ncbi:hypothetical protein [Acetobacter okinawensis]|nr:hypothetical protein [Acetobacter okinawensis]